MRGWIPGHSTPVGTVALDVDEANTMLAEGDYGVHLGRRDGAVVLLGVGAGISLGTAPTWGELARVLVRTRRTRLHHDPARLHHLARTLDVPMTALPSWPSQEWSRFAAAVGADPLLRMHCATQPLLAVLSPTEPMAAPVPSHPRHPGGTLAVTASGLVRTSTGLPNGLLEQVVGNRFERGEGDASYFLEHFVRPPLRAFRLALERCRTLLVGLHGCGIGFELSPELEATGRIVVTTAANVRDSSCVDSSEVAAAVQALLETVDILSTAFTRTGTLGDGVSSVITEELSDLEPHAAATLAGRHRLRSFVRTVPPVQDGVLKDVLHTVQERTRNRRWDTARPVPAVIVDPDLPETAQAGLDRFAWDVRDAGGRVELDGRIHEDTDVVAVFGAASARCVATAEECSGARPVTVDPVGAPSGDPVPVISSFETSPRRGRARAASGLSHAHSLEEVQIGQLRENRAAERWAVRLSTDESLGLVESMVADTDRAAERTVAGARAKFAEGEGDERERAVEMLHHVFTRKQFLKGSRSHYGPEDMRRDAWPFLRTSSPIEVVLLGFPVKQCLNRLKASGPMPDLAELGALVRLRELQTAVSAIHPPGLHFNVLTDGRHFRSRPTSVTAAYSGMLRRYSELAGIGERITFTEIDELAADRMDIDVPGERTVRFARYRRLFDETLRGFDITDDPLRTLAGVAELATAVDGPYAAVLARSLGVLPEMVMSMVYSVSVPLPRRMNRLSWSRLVHADVYDLTERVAPDVRRARAAVLRRAWHNVIDYLATMRVDEDLAYDDLFPHRVRLTVNAATPGRCGFTYLGGSGLLPWQGTGVLDERGHVAVDFAVSLLDQGFVPVYSPLLGPRQPWLMVPAGRTGVPGTGAEEPGMRLDGSFAAGARLRRR
ncbi:hypothetical protein FHX42_005011 [Saccharopolyspora lacisalsi]|uniref:Pyoverdine/dityrosine biosynthesis protein n=1 Tax=Halosaccharopolyspora lacisalsi TaxID=1000566 RepID=A0A839E6U1_9PSEU|nr:L-tyrosine/L-tryptophan isonitrile synthase family protein [Halosaccharopolyspora lacisalsi]MBA8827615.1 hypothetical protein [Halosaccharopolyspora lacisalsi]